MSLNDLNPKRNPITTFLGGLLFLYALAVDAVPYAFAWFHPDQKFAVESSPVWFWVKIGIAVLLVFAPDKLVSPIVNLLRFKAKQ